jgi:hypothetical protein
MLDAGYTPDPWQADFLRATERFHLMLCARQVGKSVTVALKALHTALTAPGSLVTIVAQRQDTAAETLRKAVVAYYRVGQPVPVLNRGKTHFELVTGSRILALPGDEKAMYGPTADLLLIDEAARVPDEAFHAASPQLSASGGRLVALSAGHQFWDSMLSSVNKRPHCVLEVCTNAGHQGSWQHGLRNLFSKSPRGHFTEVPVGVQLASWMDAASVAEDRNGMDPGEARRLFDNEWIDPGEERGFLTLAEAEACVDPGLAERDRGESGLPYYAVVDYGGVDDRCALCVLHPVPGTDRVVVDRLDCWQRSHANRVPIDDQPGDPHARSVEGWVEMVRRGFDRLTLVVDPYQLEGLAQKFERRGVRVVRFEYLAGKNNYRMAQLLQSMVRGRKIAWSPIAGRLPGAEDDTFAKELARLVRVPTSYGYKFDHESGRHDDRAAAVGMGWSMPWPSARRRVRAGRRSSGRSRGCRRCWGPGPALTGRRPGGSTG